MKLKRIALVLIAISLCESAHSKTEWQLSRAEQQKCLAILREGMRADDFWPAIHAAEALTIAGHPQEVRQYLEPKLAAEKDDQRRCGLARELVRAGDRRRSSVMLDILQKPDPHGHVHAAESLYKVGCVGDGAALEKAFAESDDIRLRIMAAAALAKHSKGSTSQEAFTFLRQTLRDEDDPAVFRLSAWVLGRIGEAKDRDLIRSRIEDTDDKLVRAFLVHALAALGDREGTLGLLRNLESDDPAIRTYAAVFAGETGNDSAVTYLTRQLDDTNVDARIRAAQAILVLARGTGSNVKESTIP